MINKFAKNLKLACIIRKFTASQIRVKKLQPKIKKIGDKNFIIYTNSIFCFFFFGQKRGDHLIKLQSRCMLR